MSSENMRKCFKCGSSAGGNKLFRVLKPGTKNLLRCEQWAKYLYPGRDVGSVEFLKKIYNEHRMICDRHFRDEDFTDNSRTKLLRTAVPCDVTKTSQTQTVTALINLDQPNPSNPLKDITNVHTDQGDCSATKHDPSTSTTQAAAETSKAKSENEIMLQSKCKKYMQRICQLQNRIRNLKPSMVLKEIDTDRNVKKLSSKVTPAFALLLQGQIRNSKRKIRGRRWSKEEKITALRIYKRSPTCYRLLRRLFTLPSPSTLKNLLNKVPFGVGCCKPVFEVLKKYAKSQKPADNEYILMFDEMSLKKHFYYDSKSDLIEGYQDHGTQGRTADVASHALVFMIASIRKRIKQPVAHYYSGSFSTADRLAVLIKEVLQQCSEAGINIAATVCDMNGPNRRAYSILGATTEHPYITYNEREIVTLYDTPHLLKSFRNLFLKYDIECNTNIHSTDKTGKGFAKWSHIIQFHEIDSTNPNFVFAPCLKKDHLNPNTKQKMKVNLAAQVLSHSVAAGMYAKISDGTLTSEAAVTANIISNMDKLFDSLNSDTCDLRRGKPYATNLSNSSPHKQLFNEMKSFFTTLKFMGVLRKPPSQEGWVWTLNGVERIWQNLSKKHGIKSIATRRLQQDALENLFGCIRANCGSNTNPTSGQFLAGLKTSILSNLAHMGTTGNCETDNSVIINNFDTLLSVSKPIRFSTGSETVHTSSEKEIENSVIAFQIDEFINDNNSEIQACAYVCGFLVKLLPTKECHTCKKIFIADDHSQEHLFVEFKEYSESKKSLTYVTKEFITCVEFGSTLTNEYLKEKSYTKNLKKNVMEKLKASVSFDFMASCSTHKEDNVNIIAGSLFMICVKRFCTLQNRSLAAESSASALKRKMDIILHK